MKNKFIKLILIVAASFSFSGQAYAQYEPAYNYDYDTCDAYVYTTVGTGPIFLIPNFGLGYRERQFQSGWDTSINFATLGYIHQVSLHLAGQCYLNPFSRTSPYLGLGVVGSGIFTNHKDWLSTIGPDFILGKEFEGAFGSRQFFEMHVVLPSIVQERRHTYFTYLPMMYIKYGTSF